MFTFGLSNGGTLTVKYNGEPCIVINKDGSVIKVMQDAEVFGNVLVVLDNAHLNIWELHKNLIYTEPYTYSVAGKELCIGFTMSYKGRSILRRYLVRYSKSMKLEYDIDRLEDGFVCRKCVDSIPINSSTIDPNLSCGVYKTVVVLQDAVVGIS